MLVTSTQLELGLEIKMRTCVFLFVVMVSGAVAASAQNIGSSAANSPPQMLTLTDNPQHASQVGLAPEHDLLERGGSQSAHGERPLWEVMPAPKVISLGEIARAYREEHESAKKAVLIWVN